MTNDFLQLTGRRIVVFGVANRKSVAYHVHRALREAGATVVDAFGELPAATVGVLRARGSKSLMTEAERRAAEKQRREAEERAARAEAAAAEAERRAEAARVAAEQKAERDRAAAIEAERRRVAEAAERERREAEARAADRAHRGRINKAAADALVVAGLTDEQARLVITAIVAGSVPAVSIRY